jgi:phosphoserine phosphatase
VIACDDANRLMLLMADATGHGVGPAISATQLRSMLRMAVRLGADLPSIARHVNAQLCQDLPAGRFITAWMGELDAHRWQLRSFSAGQAPLLLCRAATGETESIPADTVPFGVLDELRTEVEVAIAMRPGDVFAVFSDGIFEGRNAADEQFGMERTIELLREAVICKRSAAQIIEQLLRDLASYAGERPADDDRTAIVVRRKSP